MFEGIFAINTLPAQTGSYPGKPASRDTQQDHDVCPRCGGRRSAIKTQLVAGGFIIINCRECREFIDAWWKTAKERMHGSTSLNR